jgi:glycosyltransferase involved in cell wall biosynthesis
MSSREQPLVSVIVPCRGHGAELVACLDSLARQQAAPAHEVIVVDSAADPRVATVVRGHAAVRLVRSDDGLMPGPARNLGVRHSAGKYLGFIDADCMAEAGWLGAAVAGLEDGARLVGGPVLDALPRNPIAGADNLLQFADFPASRQDGEASYFATCNLGVGRAEFDALGGFADVGMPAGEDTLFCDAALERWPHGVRFVRGMRVRHRGRSTVAELWRHQASFGYCRGLLGLRLQPLHRRLGRLALMVPIVALKRLVYIAGAVARRNPVGLVRFTLLSPWLAIGLAAWAGGFRRGCRAAKEREE